MPGVPTRALPKGLGVTPQPVRQNQQPVEKHLWGHPSLSLKCKSELKAKFKWSKSQLEGFYAEGFYAFMIYSFAESTIIKARRLGVLFSRPPVKSKISPELI